MLKVKLVAELSAMHIAPQDLRLLAGQNEHSIGYRYPGGYFVTVPLEEARFQALSEEMVHYDGYSVAFRDLLQRIHGAGISLLQIDLDLAPDPDLPVLS